MFSVLRSKGCRKLCSLACGVLYIKLNVFHAGDRNSIFLVARINTSTLRDIKQTVTIKMLLCMQAIEVPI
jgi:hypothetical protein